VAATSKSTSSDTAHGRQLYAPPGSRTTRSIRCGHTFATWAIEEGSIPLPQLATIMGTSIRELEDTYHRWQQRPSFVARVEGHLALHSLILIARLGLRVVRDDVPRDCSVAVICHRHMP
jgi:hypothetical protein